MRAAAPAHPPDPHLQPTDQMPMQTRRLGNSDMAITPVGFGTGMMADADYSVWARTGQAGAVGTVRRALELGVNWIDAGLRERSIEPVAARALHGWPGAGPYLFTRCIESRGTREGGEVTVPFDEARIRRACEGSLRSLETDAIDLYLIDWPPHLHPDYGAHAWWAMAQLQHEGKVRWIGLGNCGLDQLRMAREIAPVTAVQSPYLPMDHEVGREILPHCTAAGIGVLGSLPRFGELPTGGVRFEAGTRQGMAKKLGLRAADYWFNGPYPLEPGLSRALAAADEFQRIAGEHGRSADEVAIAWAARLPGITGVAIGAATTDQVQDLAFHLSDEDCARIDALWS